MTTGKDRKTEPTVKELQARVRSLERERDEYWEMLQQTRKESESRKNSDLCQANTLRWLQKDLKVEHQGLLARTLAVEQRMRSMGFPPPGDQK